MSLRDDCRLRKRETRTQKKTDNERVSVEQRVVGRVDIEEKCVSDVLSSSTL